MESTSGLFLRKDGGLIELREQSYDAEAVLQAILADHPELLAASGISPEDPRRFVLVRREAPVGGLSLDHLFLDQDAVPTLVETKRSINTQNRREVVAQMLDYAANAAAQWSSEQLQAWLEGQDGPGLDALEHHFDDDASFWERVAENLTDGRVRLIFISDQIPASLRTIVEFLNERMTPTEVLAIELRQFLTESGEQLLQSRVVGQTSRATRVKGPGGSPTPRRDSVLDVLVRQGALKDGDSLWLVPSGLPSQARQSITGAGDERLRVTLQIASDGSVSFSYQPPSRGQRERLTPSSAWGRIATEIKPDLRLTGSKYKDVNTKYATSPSGPTLAQCAEELGW
jgi:hypothetical protein